MYKISTYHMLLLLLTVPMCRVSYSYPQRHGCSYTGERRQTNGYSSLDVVKISTVQKVNKPKSIICCVYPMVRIIKQINTPARAHSVVDDTYIFQLFLLFHWIEKLDVHWKIVTVLK